jgi:response regulator NasT
MHAPATGLHVVVVGTDVASAAAWREALALDGHQVVDVRELHQLAELCRVAHPSVIVADLHLPDGPGLGAVAQATGERPAPVVVVCDELPDEVLDGFRNLPIEAVLTKPVAPAGLRAAVTLAACRFAQIAALRAEVADLRRQLDDRKLIERAKGIVTRRLGLDEVEAFRAIRKSSSDTNRKLAEVARRIIECDAVFEELEHGARPVSRNGSGRTGHNGHGAADHYRASTVGPGTERSEA